MIPSGRLRFGRLLVGGLLCLAVSGRALGDDADEQGMTGDWGGLRSDLAAHGVALKLQYVFEGAFNAAGGQRQKADMAGQLGLGVGGDTEKLFGLPDGRFVATVTHREGRNLDTDAQLPVLQQIQEVYGRGDIWRLTQLWYEQGFFDRAVAIKIGRITEGEGFAAFSCDFENLSFCGAPPGNLVGDYWYNWPVSQWGGRLKIRFGSDYYLQAGLRQVDPRNLEPGRGFNLGFSGVGVLAPIEAAWTPHFGPNALAGSYKFGGWYASIDGKDVFTDVRGQAQLLTGLPPAVRAGRYGWYLNFQQQVTGTNDGTGRGLTLFLNYTQADRRTALTDRQIALGASMTGIVPGRPQDAIGLAFAETHVNGRVAWGQTLATLAGHPVGPVQHSEYVTELDYNFQATSWLSVRPNLQFIHSPGGIAEQNDAWVIGLKAQLTL